MNKISSIALATIVSASFSMPAFAGASKFSTQSASPFIVSEQTATAADEMSSKIMSSTIQVPGSKTDLLVGVSIESFLSTYTNVKGKNGGSDKQTATAGILISVEMDGSGEGFGNGVPASPDTVNFNSRKQEMTSTFGGVIESCNVNVDPDSGIGTITVKDDCVVTDEQVSLLLETTSANHFNFLFFNVGPGEHTIDVYATISSSEDTVDSSSVAVVNVGNLTVEAVSTSNSFSQ